MQKVEYTSYIYTTVLFSFSKRSYIEFYALLNNEDSWQKRITKYC